MSELGYIRAGHLDQAVDFLKDHGPETKVLAGGTDIMVDLRAGDIRPVYLLDVSRLADLRRIESRAGRLRIGAAVTISEILTSELVGRFAPALKGAAEKFASHQVRNVATIGGNIAHCSPCGDTVPPLLIHDAVATVVSPAGSRQIAVEEMASGPYHCSLAPDELILHFELLPQPEAVTHAAFRKIGRRRALAVSRMSMAVMASQAGDGTVDFMRFALGACTPTPHRFVDIERALIGKAPDDRLLWQTGRLLAEQMLSVTGRRPSAVYKEPAIQGLFVRLMQPLVH